jgi:hypothetical protein
MSFSCFCFLAWLDRLPLDELFGVVGLYLLLCLLVVSILFGLVLFVLVWFDSLFVMFCYLCLSLRVSSFLAYCCFFNEIMV